jgi:simple sugar transport system permease protein
MLKTNVFISAIVIFLSFFIAAILLLIFGRNPSGMYQAVFQAASGFDPRRGWNVRFIGEWLVLAIPFILCALSMGFSVRCGLFNLGAEGQYIAGLTAAQLLL